MTNSRETHSTSADSRGFESVFESLNQTLMTGTYEIPAFELDPISLPAIYVVGPPRSGTTLLGQLLAKHLNVGYINNLTARFWMRPSIGIYLSRALDLDSYRAQIELKSYYGETRQPWGPHEFGHYWSHWFQLQESSPHNLESKHLDSLEPLDFSLSLENEILGPIGKPVVFKNIVCGFQAQYLANAHANSLFVFIERDPIDTGISLLNARFHKFGSTSHWWSLRPKSLMNLPKDDVDQIAAQVLDSISEMKQELFPLGRKVISTDYRTLCADPASVVNLIRQRVSELYAIEIPQLSMPEPTSPKSRDSFDDALVLRLAQSLKKYQAHLFKGD